MASPLSPETRAANLTALGGGRFDLLVVGGGITGAGVARDATLRGLSVALVDRVDWAAGTSSRSSKLIHGGVRYLQQGDVGLVREAAHERAVLRRIAPHRTQPLRMVMPTYGRAMHAKLAMGLWTFEKIATVPSDERHEMWNRAETLAEEPVLAPDGLHGAAMFVEYLTDDARLVLDTVKGAHQAGAVCANHAAVTSLAVVGEGIEAVVRDGLTGAEHRARARMVVNAGGPWVDEVRAMAGAAAGSRLHLTRGIHLVLRHERLPLRNVIVMQTRDKRSVFAVPRGAVVYVGTTDTDFGDPTEYPDVTAFDADYLLEAVNRTCAGAPVTRADVVSAWAGLRPLLHEEGKKPSEISRKDEIMTAADGRLVSIAGGKLTTYRRMAERVVDLVCKQLRHEAPCRTGDVPLPGGERSPAEPATLQESVRGLDRNGAARLVGLYGAEAEAILGRAATEPGTVGGQPDVLRAEVAHAVDAEMALTLEDVLERRMRLLLFDAGQGLGGVDAVAALVAARLGWNAERTAAEVAAYRRLAASLTRFP